MPLTPKQQRFVSEYLIDLNATQAAIRAGYSAKTARAIAAENLTKPDIAEALQAAQAKHAEEAGVSVQEWLAELDGIGFAPLSKKIRPLDKLKALELRGKHAGWFKENAHHDVEVVFRWAREGEARAGA